jgi:muramoyltetrapeptide carboxypeptidase
VLPGDRVGIAALSGPVDPDRLSLGMAALERLGFEAVPAANLDSRSGMFAGSDAERLEAFHQLAADPSIAAILFARGGHGVLRVLPGIDWDLLAAHPRAYVGFSDLTPFLLEVVRRLGLVAFHGPMVAADFARGMDEGERASFMGALAGRYPAEQWFPEAMREGAEPVRGVLLGGCLSLLAATLGTPYAADLEGASCCSKMSANRPIGSTGCSPSFACRKASTGWRVWWSGTWTTATGRSPPRRSGASCLPTRSVPSPGRSRSAIIAVTVARIGRCPSACRRSWMPRAGG